jgi:hypothetical protein
MHDNVLDKASAGTYSHLYQAIDSNAALVVHPLNQ